MVSTPSLGVDREWHSEVIDEVLRLLPRMHQWGQSYVKGLGATTQPCAPDESCRPIMLEQVLRGRTLAKDVWGHLGTCSYSLCWNAPLVYDA